MSIVDNIKGIFNKRNMYIIAGITIFVSLSIYTYINYIKPKMSPAFIPNNEYIKKSDEENVKEADLMLFYVTWCPHCKQAKPIWETMKEKYNGTIINGTRIQFKSYDCDKEEQMADKYEIEGFPTIKLLKGDNDIVEFDAKLTEDSLTQFLHSVL